MIKKRNSGSDAGNNKWVDENDAPFLDEDFFNRAKLTVNGVVVQEMKPRGRPKKDNPKKLVSIRLNPELVRKLKKSGKGWQTRVDEILCREFHIS